MSFFPLFAAATHVLRLNAINYRSVQVAVHIEQTEVSPDGVVASPTRTIFSRTSTAVPTDRIPGFRCFATREWLPLLKDTANRHGFFPSAANRNAASWDVALVPHCEGTMLVKDTRTVDQAKQQWQVNANPDPTAASATVGDIPITIRAQILGELDSGETRIIAESGSLEISAARILFVRKVTGLILHTPLGDVAVVVSVAREDANGCQQRVEQFLVQQQSGVAPANAAGIASNIIRAANGDEIMVFCQLRKKFQTSDFEGRLARYLELYSLDAPDDYGETRDALFAAQLLRDWAPTEELLFVALATMFGPEQDALSSWVRFRAMNSVANGDEIPREIQTSWRTALRGLLSRGDATTDLALQAPVHDFFTRCAEEISSFQYNTDSVNKFREPPPFLYLYDNEVREMLHIDNFAGIEQSVHPGDLEGQPEKISASSGGVKSVGDEVEIRRVRNSANVIVDVVSLGVQTKKDAGDDVSSQCNFFEKPPTMDAMAQAIEYKLTSDEFVQTRDDVFFRTANSQTDPQQIQPTADAEVDATERVPTSSRDTQTVAPAEIPKRSVRTSTVGDLPEVGFVEEILAKDGDLRKQLEKALEAQTNERRRVEGELARSDQATEAARLRLKEELDLRQGLERELEKTKEELKEHTVSMQKMTTQVRLAELERKELAAKREDTLKTIASLEEQVIQQGDDKAAVEKELMAQQNKADELAEALAAAKDNYESIKRQCDILSEDAKASRTTAEEHFKKMRALEDKLLDETTQRAKMQESFEVSVKSDMLNSMHNSESLLDKVQRLETENDALLRERDLFLRSGAVQAAALVAAEEAAEAEALQNEDPEFIERVQQAKARLKQFHMEKDKRTKPPQAYADIDNSPPSELRQLHRPHLPSHGAPICVVDDQYNHLTPVAGRHRIFRGERGVNTPVGGFDGSQHDSAFVSPGDVSSVHRTLLASPPNRVGGAAAGASSPSQHSHASGAALMTMMLGATSPEQSAAAAAGAASIAASAPRALIEEGWSKHRRGLVDAARALWLQVAEGSAATSEQASTPAFVAAKYEAGGLVAELLDHNSNKAAELYSAAVRYWPNQSVLLRLAGLHDREANGDKDVAVDLYRLAAGMGSASAKQRLAEMMA